MFKKRYFSVHHKFKSNIFFKISLFLGIILLISYIVLKLIPMFGEFDISNSSTPDTLLSFSIIFFAVSIIMYFFCCQFRKLEKIADEIEKGENFKEPKK